MTGLQALYGGSWQGGGARREPKILRKGVGRGGSLVERREIYHFLRD